MGRHWFEEYRPELAMVGLQFIYAGSALSAKAAFSSGVNPMVFIVYRQLTATIALVPTTILATRGRGGQLALGMKGFSLLFLAAFVGVTLNQFLYYQGLKLASASLASAVSNMIPAITFFMAASAGLERIELSSPRSMAKIFGTIICVGGAISIVLFKGPKLTTIPNDKWMIGCLFLLGSSCCWSLWLILQVPICKNYVDPLSLSSWMCFLASLQSTVFTFFLEPDLKAWRLNSILEIMCCVYAGVIGSGVSFYVQSWCISRRGPLFSAMFSPLFTVVVTVVAILLLHEHLYFGSVVGAAAVVVGLYAVLWGKAEDYEDATKRPPSIGQPSESDETNTKESLLDRNLQDETV